jgi:phage shock protein C
MQKKLYRAQNDRMISGVCGGIGEYFDLDPTLVRLAFVLLAMFTAGWGMAFAYLVLAIIIPEGPSSSNLSHSDFEADSSLEEDETL